MQRILKKKANLFEIDATLEMIGADEIGGHHRIAGHRREVVERRGCGAGRRPARVGDRDGEDNGGQDVELRVAQPARFPVAEHVLVFI